MSRIPRGYRLMFFLLVYIFAAIMLMALLQRFFPLNLGLVGSIIVSQVVMFFIPFVAYVIITKQRFADVLPMRSLGFKNFYLVVLITLVTLPMAAFLSALTSIFVTNRVSEIMMDMSTHYPFWLMLLAVGVAPSLFEEFMFRGAFYKEFSHMPIKKAAFLNGLFFGIIHMNWQQFFYAFALGMIFAYFVYYTGSILAPIIGHFVVNGINTALIHSIPPELLQEIEQLPYYQQPSPVSTAIVMGIISLIVTPLFIFLFKKLRDNNMGYTNIDCL